ncbi:biotin transporter BioY, partial [Enterococcus faecalis]|nr:biotin transporter BioY [Enterococcus faecalis]
MYRKSQMIARMSLMLALLIITARLVIPLPLFDYLSLQIITVYLIYPTLGMKNGLIVTCSYLILGIIGLPIFASGGGYAYIFKPTFGFLLAFVTLPIIQSFISNKFNNGIYSSFKKNAIINICCLLYIYLIGIIYKILILSFYTNNVTSLSILISITTLIDFSFDLLLVLITSLIMLKLNQLNK